MKTRSAFTILALITLAATPAMADEFGKRFWNQSGLALMDPPHLAEENEQPQNDLIASDMDAAAKAMQDIAPAAGDAEENEAQPSPAKDQFLQENTDTDIGP